MILFSILCFCFVPIGHRICDISQKEINFLDTTVFKGERFNKESILDIRTHFKATETFQYTHFSSCHAPGVAKGFIKGEALRLLRTNSSKPLFEENISNFKSRLRERGYPSDLVEKILSEVKFTERKSALQEKTKSAKKTFCLLSRNTIHQCRT